MARVRAEEGVIKVGYSGPEAPGGPRCFCTLAGRWRESWLALSLSVDAVLTLVLRRSWRLTRIGVFAFAVSLAGVAVRVLHAFPVHKYPDDADALQAGLRALQILAGHHPVFYSRVSLGAFESYLHALFFSILGVSRASLSLATLLSGTLALFVFSLFARSLLGPVAARFAFPLLAFAPAAYLFWTYLPISYAETALFGAVTLWLAEVLRRNGARLEVSFAFGAFIGLGWWNSPQSLGCSVPALLWVAWTRPEVIRRARFSLLASAGFLAGAFPWIAYNVRHPLASFREDFVTRPVAGLAQAFSNFRHLLGYSLPELVASLDPEGGAAPSRFSEVLRATVIVVYVASVLFALIQIGHWIRRSAGRRSETPSLLLPLLIGTVVCCLFVFSRAGESRGMTSRYVILLYPALALMVGGLLARFWRLSRIAACALTLLILVFNATVYPMPGTTPRKHWEANLQKDLRLIQILRRERIDFVYGDYWIAYPLNFLTRDRIRGIPTRVDDDFYGYSALLGSAPARCAVVAGSRRELERWVEEAREDGRIEDAGWFVFLPSRNPPAGSPFRVLDRFRAVEARINWKATRERRAALLSCARH